MSGWGQNAKYSLRADVFCFASNNGHPPRGGISADQLPMGNRVGLILGRSNRVSHNFRVCCRVR